VGDVNQRLFLTRALARANGPVLEIGSKDYGSASSGSTTSFRDVFAGEEYIGVDLAPGKDVDRVIDLAAGTGDLRDGHFALAICCSVLEHVRRPWEMAANITRLLRPGGALYVGVPWVWRYHPYPDDYFRFSPRGIAELFPGVTWQRMAYSTTARDEFFEFGDDGAGIDNSLAKVVETPKGPRKYLPYLQVHMFGVRM